MVRMKSNLPLICPLLSSAQWCRGTGNWDCGQSVTLHLCHLVVAGLCPCPCPFRSSLPQHSYVQQGPPFMPCSTPVPMGGSSPSPPTPPRSPPSGCSSSPGLLCGGTHGLCPLKGDGNPLLHRGLLCSCTGISAPQGAHALQGQPRASPRLQEASALCLEHLLPSFCTDPGACRAVSHSFLTPLSELLLCSSDSVSYICSPRVHPTSLMVRLWQQGVPVIATGAAL